MYSGKIAVPPGGGGIVSLYQRYQKGFFLKESKTQTEVLRFFTVIIFKSRILLPNNFAS
jgi:hypothetical protein